MPSEPSIARSAGTASRDDARPRIGERALTGIRAERYVPQRGLVERLRASRTDDGLEAIAERHDLDPATRSALAAALGKVGVPPLTPRTAEKALGEIVRFSPINADALRPFVVVGPDPAHRLAGMVAMAGAMRAAGRSVRLLAEGKDASNIEALGEAASALTCRADVYTDPAECLAILRRTDLGCLGLIEAAFDLPAGEEALARLHRLTRTVGAEAVAVLDEPSLAAVPALARAGMRRIVLVQQTGTRLGPLLRALGERVALAEILRIEGASVSLRAATPALLADMLIAPQR